MSSGSTGSTFPRWQLALLLGAPVALTLGYLYYRQSSSYTAGDEKKKKSLDSSKPVSIDEGTGAGGDAATINQSKRNGGPATSEKPLTPLEQAIEFKNQGNDKFRKALFPEAIELYDKAIHNCPSTKSTELATFYQNRAAAYENMKNWEAVILRFCFLSTANCDCNRCHFLPGPRRLHQGPRPQLEIRQGVPPARQGL